MGASAGTGGSSDSQGGKEFEERVTGFLAAIRKLAGDERLAVAVLEATGARMRPIDRLLLLSTVLPTMHTRWAAEIHYRDGGTERIADLKGVQAIMLVLQAFYSQAKVAVGAREAELLRDVGRGRELLRP